MSTSVGIDLSLKSAAVVILDEESGEIIVQKTGIGETLSRGSPWWAHRQRVKTIIQRLSVICDFYPSVHGSIVWEGPSYGSKGAQLFYLGGLFDAFYERVQKWDAQEYIEVPPTNLKKFVTGKGNSGKPQMAAHTQKRWGHIFDDDDLTDAYGLSQIGRAVRGHLPGHPKTHLLALTKISRCSRDELEKFNG
jgi:crossover junction endodeoxyribonuclease RuvC